MATFSHICTTALAASLIFGGTVAMTHAEEKPAAPAPAAATPKIGDKAPAFSLETLAARGKSLKSLKSTIPRWITAVFLHLRRPALRWVHP